MLLADHITDPSKDDVTIYELPELNEPDSILLPVVHQFPAPSKLYGFGPRFEDFGIPFYIVLTKEERADFEKIFEKIRQKYTQFSSAEELRNPPQPAPVPIEIDEETQSEEDSADAHNVMEEVVLTRQDTNRNMVTIHVKPYKPDFLYNRGPIEMPTQFEKPDHLQDLRDYLRPLPPPRMQSLAPSAMESVHQDLPTPDDSDHNEPMDGDASEETVFLSQHGTFVEPSFEGEDPELTTQMEDLDDEPIREDNNNDLQFSDTEEFLDTERRATPPILDDSDSDGLVTPSQLGEMERGHAPSPAIPDIPPSYSSLFPDPTETTDSHELNFGDALVCNWSEAAYQHVFNNPRIPVYWDSFEPWVDPTPPPSTTSKPKRNLNLEDCLDEFAREEELGQEDLWYCPRCKKHRQARKTLKLWRVPDIFAVHLKRFSAHRGFRDKLDNLIEFPVTDLDLTERVGDKTWIQEERGGEKLIYDLFAVDNHYGVCLLVWL